VGSKELVRVFQIRKGERRKLLCEQGTKENKKEKKRGGEQQAVRDIAILNTARD